MQTTHNKVVIFLKKKKTKLKSKEEKSTTFAP